MERKIKKYLLELRKKPITKGGSDPATTQQSNGGA
jgi:hypothetical protein